MSDIEKELKQYHILHKLEKYKNYNNKIKLLNKEEESKLAEYINKNYNTMDEIEMKMIALKCMDINDIKKHILSFELENYIQEPVEHMELTDFIKQVKKIFIRYQCKAGGFIIEDIEWTIHKTGSHDYDILENEILFANTIAVCDEDDIELENYFNNLLPRLNSVAKNITVELREDHGKRNNHILIWATDTTKTPTDTVIGL